MNWKWEFVQACKVLRLDSCLHRSILQIPWSPSHLLSVLSSWHWVAQLWLSSGEIGPSKPHLLSSVRGYVSWQIEQTLERRCECLQGLVSTCWISPVKQVNTVESGGSQEKQSNRVESFRRSVLELLICNDCDVSQYLYAESLLKQQLGCMNEPSFDAFIFNSKHKSSPAWTEIELGT